MHRCTVRVQYFVRQRGSWAGGPCARRRGGCHNKPRLSWQVRRNCAPQQMSKPSVKDSTFSKPTLFLPETRPMPFTLYSSAQLSACTTPSAQHARTAARRPTAPSPNARSADALLRAVCCARQRRPGCASPGGMTRRRWRLDGK